MRRIITNALIFLVKIYKNGISPLLMPACRYTPTCSQYAEEALRKYGPWKGLKMSVKRMSTCHPWGGHGYDPVP